MSVTQLDALSCQEQWTVGMIDKVCSFLDSFFVHRRDGLIATDEVHLLGLVFHHSRLGVLGKVEHHWTWTACTSNIERTAYGPRHIFGTANLIAPLRDWVGHIHHIDLLERIGTQHGNTYLTADDNHRRRVNHGISHTCDGVRSTWT